MLSMLFYMNTLAYIIYLSITYLITVHVGLRFYKSGRTYILTLFHGEESLTDFVNKLLLVGYYLLNLGYAAVMLRFWDTITSWAQLLTSICSMTGKIILTLALIHFVNMAILFFISKRNPDFIHHKI